MDKSMSRNGYVPSILDTAKDTCYTCGMNTATAVHEVYHGTANRRISKANGFWVNLCPRCHYLVHTGDGDLDRQLKRHCYRVYCTDHSKQEFYDLIGKYYE